MKISSIYDIYINTCSGTISTDTRNLTRGSLFVALRGDTWNGNNFAIEALQNGCSVALVDDAFLADSENCIFTENVEQTLQDLARYHRERLDIPVLAITGSNGKTTTKELITRVLSTEMNVHATQGNLNNHLGVPLTVLQIKKDTQIAIIEMGANHVGEIALLSSIAKPNYGLITNIGRAHIGLFGSYENIIKGKTELYDFLQDNSGTCFVWESDHLLMEKSSGITRVIFGEKTEYPYHMVSTKGSPCVSFGWNSETVSTKLIGEYNFGNIAYAVAVGNYFGISSQNIMKAVGEYEPNNLRSEIFQDSKNNFILKDYYNANTSSMREAISNAVNITKEKKLILILGDMFELGEYSHAEHKEILDQARETSAEKIILVGSDFCSVFSSDSNEMSERIIAYPTTEEACVGLDEYKFSNSVLLLKASRGMKFEKIFETLIHPEAVNE